MPRSRTKAQQLARLNAQLQKCLAARQALERELSETPNRFQPSFWTLVDWIKERDRRNEAIRQEAIARAVSHVSLDPASWRK